MFNIEKYLEKFSKNVRFSEMDKNKIIEIIKNHTGLVFSPESIEIKDYIVKIQASPAVKNKIFIYKEVILSNITSSITNKIVDIR